VNGGWTELHTEELHGLYSSQNVISDEIKEDEIGRACGMHVEMRNAYKILVGRLEQTDHS
jgi:hypothetical protein